MAQTVEFMWLLEELYIKLGSHLRKYCGYAFDKCHILRIRENNELCLSSAHEWDIQLLKNNHEDQINR